MFSKNEFRKIKNLILGWVNVAIFWIVFAFLYKYLSILPSFVVIGGILICSISTLLAIIWSIWFYIDKKKQKDFYYTNNESD